RGWTVRVPRRLQEAGLRVGKTVSELSQTLGRSPTIREIAAGTGLSEDEVLEAMDLASAYSPVSLDAPAYDPEGDRGAQEPGVEDENLELLEGWASLAPALQELPARERRILYLRFFRGLTQSQIANEIG